MLLASHATSRRAIYDPVARKVVLPPDATPYELAHERAHECQQQHRTRAWRFHERTKNLPYICRLARLWLEAEAAKLALGALARGGLLDRHARADARSGLWSFAKSLFSW